MFLVQSFEQFNFSKWKNFFSLWNQIFQCVLFVKTKMKLYPIFIFVVQTLEIMKSIKFLSCRRFDASTPNTAACCYRLFRQGQYRKRNTVQPPFLKFQTLRLIVLGKKINFEYYELGKSDNENKRDWKRKLTLF